MNILVNGPACSARIGLSVCFSRFSGKESREHLTRSIVTAERARGTIRKANSQNVPIDKEEKVSCDSWTVCHRTMREVPNGISSGRRTKARMDPDMGASLAP